MPDNEQIVKDPEILAVKDKMMRKLRKNSLLTSVSTIGALIGGPLFAAGIMGVATALFSAGAATATGLAVIGGLPVLAMLGVGALFVGISVGAAYKASRIWQSKQFDNFEVGAQSTAHHLVQELKANNMCLVEEHKTARADGKSWEQYMKERSAAQALQSNQLH